MIWGGASLDASKPSISEAGLLCDPKWSIACCTGPILDGDVGGVDNVGLEVATTGLRRVLRERTGGVPKEVFRGGGGL